MSNTIRSAVTVADAHGVIEGAGLKVNRAIPTSHVNHLDPFLLLDHFGPVSYGPGEAHGVPDHPHRGFETVTYILDGYMEHKDSAGHSAVLGPGDLQWMTAGSGIVHSEMPEANFKRDGGVLQGFQLWVNLPAALKMTAPRYQDVAANAVPVVTSDDGKSIVRVVAGNVLGHQGAVATHTPITYIHITLKPGGSVTLPVPAEQDAGAYLFGANVIVDENGTEAGYAQIVRFGDGDSVMLTAPQDNDRDAEILLLAGTPIREPIARYGPFVMNTDAEIRQAILDYQKGRMGRIAVSI
jgi:redox-sensitive bicupin YhaK (pirin superfamily)